MLENPDYYKKKQASEKQTQRAEKMKIDPEGFRETESIGPQQRRTQEMSEKPDHYKKKQASEKQTQRAEKMEIDPEGFRKTESIGQQ